MDRIDDKLKLLQPVLGKLKIGRLRQMYFFEDDFRQKREIENYLDLLISRHVKTDIEDQIFLPPPSKELCDGEIDVGRIEYLNKPVHPFKLKFSDVNRHMGIFGQTGSGKTTFALNVIRQLHKNRIPFLIFDWEKSYRNLVKEFSDVQVFTPGKDINPLFLNFLTVPPGIEYDEYIKSIIAVISEDYIGGIGADTMLLNYMEQAYQETKNPVFEDLKQIVVGEINKDMRGRGRLSGRSGLWKESVSRQITFMSKGAAGRIINERKSHSIPDLLSKNIVLEFGNIKSPYDRKFFIHVILNWLSLYNQHQGILAEKLKQVLIFEEFHNIVMKGKEDNMVGSLFREARKYGTGLVAIDQTPSSIPNPIFANMNVKVACALGTKIDISAMSNAMNLNREQTPFLGMLKTGQAIINVKQRHHESFLIRPPLVQIQEDISDEEIREAMRKFSGKVRLIHHQDDDLSISHSSQSIDNSPLTPLEKVLLSDITSKQFDGVDVRTKRLGMHPSVIATLHDSLSRKGILKAIHVDKKKLFEITEYGRSVCEECNIVIAKQQTRGGLEHAFWINETLQFLRKLEFQPVCEVKGIDIVDTKAGIAVEVETGKSDIRRNLLKLENSRVSRCFMLAVNREAALKVKHLARTHPHIQLYYVKDFLQLTRDQITSSALPANTESPQ